MAEKSEGINLDLGKDKVKIHFRIPSRMPTVYATHLFVQETSDEVVASFFELVHPILNKEDDNVAILKEAGVVAECVARITIAKHKFPSFAQTFADTADRILKKFQEIEASLEKTNADDQSDNK